MSYEPTNWKDGDLVTSAKLNKMEQGIAAGGSGGITFVGTTQGSPSTPPVLDKTWQEIYDAAQEGIVYIKDVVQNESILNNPIISVVNSGEDYLITCLVDFGNKPAIFTFTAESSDDYPVMNTTNTDDTPHDTIQP